MSFGDFSIHLRMPKHNTYIHPPGFNGLVGPRVDRPWIPTQNIKILTQVMAVLFRSFSHSLTSRREIM